LRRHHWVKLNGSSEILECVINPTPILMEPAAGDEGHEGARVDLDSFCVVRNCELIAISPTFAELALPALHIERCEFSGICLRCFDERGTSFKSQVAIAQLIAIFHGIAEGGDGANEKKNTSYRCS